MKKWLFVCTRDPFESREFDLMGEYASRFVANGEFVAVYLAENGVLAARAEARNATTSSLLKLGIEVAVDDFSSRERGLIPSKMSEGVRLATLDNVLNRICAGWNVIWR